MRYPPSISIRPQASWVYRGVVMLLAMLIVAASAVSTGATAIFSLKNLLIAGLGVLASAWALWDAWQVPQGQLSYAQGLWQWRPDAPSQESITGTLQLHLDLQTYLLVRFIPDAQHSSQTTTLWLHFEARHLDPPGWQALRRAVHFPQRSGQERASDELTA